MLRRPYILVAGLPATSWGPIPAHIRETIRLGIATSMEEMSSAGYEVQPCYSSPEPGGLDELIKSLKARKPDGVVIGFGVRGNKELSSLFEDMVNAVVENAPSAKLMFNSSPEDTIEHVKKWVPLK